MSLLKKLIKRYLLSKGFDQKRANIYIEELFSEWKLSKYSFFKKLWAAKRGFYAGKIDLYQLSEDNYKKYLSDYQRLWLHPLNNHFAIWINDKITLKYVLQKPFVIDGVEYDIMPEYYLYIENDGHYSYLMDSPNEIQKDKDYLKNLLRLKGDLAVKLSNGAKGVGFYRLQCINHNFYANGSNITEEFEKFESSLKGYIVTEYLHQHKDFDKIWDKSECTLRLIALKNINDRYSGGQVSIIASFARFGTSLSGSTSNMSAGGVGISFDFNTGEYGDMFYREPGMYEPEMMRCKMHPDTKMVLKGLKLPEWEITKKVILCICNHLSSLEFMGFDIIITNKGPKICEINSLPAMDVSQCMGGPLFDNEAASAFFNHKIEQKTKK